MDNNKEKVKIMVALPLVILLCVLAAVIAAAIAVSSAKRDLIQMPEPPGSAPIGTGAGITVNIPQADRPRLDPAAYENHETGLFTETGIADFVIPSQKSVLVYRDNLVIPADYGTATVISEDGFLLTCAHVIDGASAVSVLSGENEYKIAEIVAVLEDSDLALLKIEADGLVPVIFAKSSDVFLGEKIVCASAAGRYPDTLSFGNVSNLDRHITNGFIKDDSVKMSQVSCFINPGSSGAPVFNMYGQCIGIAVSKLHGDGFEGVGFIINADDTVAAIEKMMGEAGRLPKNAQISENPFFISQPDGGEGFFISDTAIK
jgi:S1-C subfamily serine protease